MTLEEGRINTCFFPRSSAFEMVFRASANTLMRTMAGSVFVSWGIERQG